MRGKRASVLLACGMYLAIGAVPFSLGETYYRWSDERGNPIHSDRPPPEGIEYEVVSTDSSMVRSVEAGKGAVPKAVNPTVGNTFEPVQKMEMAIQKNPQRCATARKNLETLDTAEVIKMRNSQGELRVISPEERSAQREQALSTIEAHCE